MSQHTSARACYITVIIWRVIDCYITIVGSFEHLKRFQNNLLVTPAQEYEHDRRLLIKQPSAAIPAHYGHKICKTSAQDVTDIKFAGKVSPKACRRGGGRKEPERENRINLPSAAAM